MNVQNTIVVNSNLGGFEFSVAADGTPMYKPRGADSALPFRKSIRIIPLGTYSVSQGKNLTVDVKLTLSNYLELTDNNFWYKITSATELDWTSGSWGDNKYSNSYNAQSGIFQLSESSTNWSSKHNFAIGFTIELYAIF